MKSLSFFSAAFALATFGLAGCAAETAPVDAESAGSEQELAASKVRLPAGDTCRDVLGPLALGLAEGSQGLAFTRGIAVSLTSETEIRTYTVSIDGTTFSDRPTTYTVELDNDSASLCFLLSAKTEPGLGIANDARTGATRSELRTSAPITVAPANDDCASTVKLLAQAAAISAVGKSFIQKIGVELVGETEDRDYVAHVDGKAFTVNGTTFPNDVDFALNLSNDSAFKCFVQEISRK